MDVAKANRWWQKAMKQEELQASHHPKAPKGHRFEVATRDKNLEPMSGKQRTRWKA